MKRNDIIELIQNHIDESQKRFGASSNYFAYQISLDLLDKLEEVGILPPPKDKEEFEQLCYQYDIYLKWEEE
jgi:hypothetical protein